MEETHSATHQLISTLAFAADKHKDQRRKGIDASPYINHPIALAHVLAFEGGISDATVLCSAILHDTVEDTATTVDELSEMFGPDVSSIVREVTDDKSLAKDKRKQLQIEHAQHLSRGAKLVKLADKICNLRDLLTSPPPGWSVERKQAYFDWAVAVASGLRGASPALEAVFDSIIRRRPELD